MDFLPYYIVVGLGVGIVIGFTGIGGGSLMTPILILFFRIEPTIAVGTDLLYAAITKASGVVSHYRNQTIHWPIVRLLALGSLPTALVSIFLFNQITQHYKHHQFLHYFIAFALLLTVGMLIFKNTKKRRPTLQEATQNFHITSKQKLITVLAGCLIGVLVSFTSVGAGVIGTSVLIFFYWRMRSVQIVGTELAHAVPLTAIAGLGHVQLGNIDFRLLIGLLIGSLPGVWLGSHIGAKIPERIVTTAIAIMLLLIALLLIFKQ